jgi:fructosamine-3-kinase
MSALLRAIEDCISKKTPEPFSQSDSSSLGGGCINAASCISGEDGRRFFVKENSIELLPSFEAEAYALGKLAATETIRVPTPVGTCHADGRAALILEFLPIGSSRGGDWGSMGRQLARMHGHTAEIHGWRHDNWIGSTQQINTSASDWILFFTDCRIAPQVQWAREKGLPLQQAEKLIEALPEFFPDYKPVPSLLHGDLWSGNAGFLENGTPVVFDPAAYYGDREADLAMTEMFGAYPREFYAAYIEEWPLDPGYRTRKHLYILYHALNHYNLFGGGYGSQAESIISQLLQSIS